MAKKWHYVEIATTEYVTVAVKSEDEEDAVAAATRFADIGGLDDVDVVKYPYGAATDEIEISGHSYSRPPKKMIKINEHGKKV